MLGRRHYPSVARLAQANSSAWPTRHAVIQCRAARRILQELTDARSKRVVSAWGIAALHASLRDADEAYRWLDVAADEGATGLIFLRVHPRLDPIRRDPRYRILLRKVGLDSV